MSKKSILTSCPHDLPAYAAMPESEKMIQAFFLFDKRKNTLYKSIMNEYKTYSDYQKYLFHHHGLSIRGLARRENLNPHTLHTVLRRFWGTDKKPQEKSQAEKYLQIAEKYLPEGESK